MTAETETEANIAYSEPEPGIYPAMFVKAENFSYEDKTTHETEHRWRWIFYSEVDEIEFDTLTSRNFRPGTNGLKLFTGILGRPPVKGDKPQDHYGTGVQLVYGPNKGGKLTVTDVHREKRLGTAPFPVATPPTMAIDNAAYAQPARPAAPLPDLNTNTGTPVNQPMTRLPNQAPDPNNVPPTPDASTDDLPF